MIFVGKFFTLQHLGALSVSEAVLYACRQNYDNDKVLVNSVMINFNCIQNKNKDHLNIQVTDFIHVTQLSN